MAGHVDHGFGVASGHSHANLNASAGDSWAAALADIDQPGDDANRGRAWSDALADIPVAPEPAGVDEWSAALEVMMAHESESAGSDAGHEPDSDGSDAGQMRIGLDLALACGANDMSSLAVFARSQPDDALDMTCAQAATFLIADHTHICSTSATADRLGLSEAATASLRAMTAEACVQLERLRVRSLLQSISNRVADGARAIEAMLFVEFVTYDVVDLKVKSTARPAALAPDIGEAGPGIDGEHAPLGEPQQNWVHDVSTGHAKLLNSECTQWLLLRVNGQFMVIRCDLRTPLQTIDHNSGECLYPAVLRLSEIGRADTFTRRIRACTTDRAKSNLRCERHVLLNRAGWHGIHTFCNVHVWARIHTRTFSGHDREISAMIALSLSLASGSSMALFRASFRRVLTKTLQIVRSAPSEDAQAYRSLVLDRFLGRSPASAERRTIISRLAGGDWRVQGTFQFYAAEDVDRGAVLNMLFSRLVPCLAGHEPKRFPRHRWTGVEDSLSDLGLLACVHGLLISVCLDYYFTNFGTATGRGQRQLGLAAAGVPPRLALADIGADGAGDAAEPPGEPSTWAAVNRARRDTVISWLESGNTARDLMLLASISPPMVRAMRKEIDASSLAADMKLNACWTHQSVVDEAPGSNLKRCQVLAAALGTVENDFALDLSRCQDTAAYEAGHTWGMVGCCE